MVKKGEKPGVWQQQHLRVAKQQPRNCFASTADGNNSPYAQLSTHAEMAAAATPSQFGVPKQLGLQS